MAELTARDYTSYIEQLLPEKFTDHEDLKTLLSVYIDTNSELFEELTTISESTDINVAAGYLLDYLGRSVGAFREGRSDQEYRDYIRLRRAINNSQGGSNDLLNLLKDISDSDRTNIWELPYNAAVLATYGSKNDYAKLVVDMDKLAPSGTRVCSVIKYEEGNIIPHSGDSKAGRFVTGGNFWIMGDEDAECGGLAECGPAPQILYNNVEGLENSYLATESDFYVEVNTSAGEDFMQAGEPLAMAGGNVIGEDTSLRALSTSHVLSYQRDGKI